MLGSNMTVRWTIKDKVLLVLQATCKPSNLYSCQHLLPTGACLLKDRDNLF